MYYLSWAIWAWLKTGLLPLLRALRAKSWEYRGSSCIPFSSMLSIALWSACRFSWPCGEGPWGWPTTDVVGGPGEGQVFCKDQETMRIMEDKTNENVRNTFLGVWQWEIELRITINCIIIWLKFSVIKVQIKFSLWWCHI